MNASAEDIQRIVDEVVRRLCNSVSDGSDVEPTTVSAPIHNDRGGDVRLNERVISLDSLDERIQGVDRIVLSARAVITPAARDELRQRGIVVTHASSDVESGRKLVVCLTELNQDLNLDVIKRESSGRWTTIEMLRSDNLVTAVGTLANRLIGGGVHGILVTSVPTVAVCLANRYSSIRAAWIHDASEVAAATQLIGANLLIVEASTQGHLEWPAILRDYFQDGSLECPSQYEKILCESRR